MISVFDTSISTLNVGDSIIMDSVIHELNQLFPYDQQVRVPSHDKIGLTSLSILRRSRCSLVGGSNILSSHMRRYRQWQISPLDAYFIRKKVTLMGVGWRDYQGSADLYTKTLLRVLLRRDGFHSVRDSYTESKLRAVGVDNVVNTGCPTMWGLTSEHCKTIPRVRGRAVVFTLTDYNRDVVADTRMIEMLRAYYTDISFWVQGSRDSAYFDSLGSLTKDIRVIPPRLDLYNNALDDDSIDYVGTRLHAGIRALQRGRRTLIVGIDNRANEKRKDFNLPVIERTRISDVESILRNDMSTEIRMPMEQISRWKNQFSS